MPRWRLMLSFLFGFAPMLGVMWGAENTSASTHTLAIAFVASYPMSILLCMMFAQADGRHKDW